MNSTRRFCTGPLAFRLDADTGFVRDVRFHGHEVVRGIYPAVREEDWGTLPPAVAPLEVRETDGGVLLRLHARVAAARMDLSWNAEIEASADGRLSYRWRGKAERDSVTNRNGLCVLHPAEAAGAPCVVEHTDGRRVAGWLPREISPHQPFRDVRAITHVLDGRAECAVRMEGEVFEMEDQRNWTDASFKTYCRPLDWPRPYVLRAGEEIQHVVTVEVRGTPVATENAGEKRSAGAPKLPRVGFTLPGPVPAALRARLHALRPAQLRVEAVPGELEATLDWARAETERFDCALVVVLRGAGEPAGREKFPARCALHLFDERGHAAPADVLAGWARAGFAEIATGSLHHFTELNRERPQADAAHTHTVFGIAAQVHASDDESILETLTQHGAVARAAHRLGGGRPVVVAPVSLGRHADSVEPRLRGEMGARWLRGSLAQLAEAGCVESATFFHTHGPAGFLSEDGETPVEKFLRTIAGRDALPPA